MSGGRPGAPPAFAANPFVLEDDPGVHTAPSRSVAAAAPASPAATADLIGIFSDVASPPQHPGLDARLFASNPFAGATAAAPPAGPPPASVGAPPPAWAGQVPALQPSHRLPPPQQEQSSQPSWGAGWLDAVVTPLMTSGLSLRTSGSLGAIPRTASLGGAASLGDGAEPEHPPETAVQPLVSARQWARGALTGVHGADVPAAKEATQRGARVIQVQTLGGEGVLGPWRRLLRWAGLQRRRRPDSYVSNELITSKYNLVNFLPKNLFHQFKRVANLYFAMLVCLQAIPGLSPVPWYTTMFPLALVLTVNAVKEAFDDYWRHRNDAQVNARSVTLVREEGEMQIEWRNVQVGDLLRLHNNEDVPADMVLLSTSDPDNLCYVETANLDGETNLKPKFCHTATADLDTAEAFSKAGYFTVECEPPNPRLYSFEGALSRWDAPPVLLAQGAFSSRPSQPPPPSALGPQGPAKRSSPRRRQPGGGAGVSGWEGGAVAAAGPSGELGIQLAAAGGRLTQDGAPGAVPATISELQGVVSRDPLDARHLLLRGCTLRKTEWVMGVVVYTGADTKVVRNMLPAPRKVTRLEQHMNSLVLYMFAGLGSLAVALALAHVVWEVTHSPETEWYLQQTDAWPDLPVGFGDFIITIVRFMILMAQAIPISLYVTLETVKVAQCKLLFDRDREMYWAGEDAPFSSRTTTLNEELGQVEYVLSDKTGTLTQNIMGFVWASIDGKLWGPAGVEAQRAAATAAAATAAGDVGGGRVGSVAGVPLDSPHAIALDADLRAALERERVSGAQGLLGPGGPLHDFLRTLALVNTVVPTATEEGQLLYQATSPDEEALVAGAALLGVKLLSRGGSGAEVEVAGRLERYEVAAHMEFTSERRRMSMVVRPAGSSRFVLLCKGADSALLPLLAGDSDGGGGGSGGDQPPRLLSSVAAHLAQASGTGYRTLVVGAREVAAPAFHTWAGGYHAALSLMTGRDEAVAAACGELETGLTLLGATAVEDKLQDGVPEAIAALRAGGIRVWVLTGDKVETAVSIAHTCQLFAPGETLLRVGEGDLRDAPHPTRAVLPPLPGHSEGAAAAAALHQMHSALRAEAAAPAAGTAGDTRTGGAAMVIDGAALALALLVRTVAFGEGLWLDRQPEAEEAFLALCGECGAVVCCRVSPMQKAQVAQVLKKAAGAVTLAIGDGANDVSMIQAAHIGVGISGREGRAAMMASDFALGQFRFLARLLLVHGRASYLRCREVVMYAFYKNAAYVSAFVFFSFYSGFSAQSIFPAAYIATFNAIWAAVPTIAWGVLEQDVSPAQALAYPGLYADTRRQGRRDFIRQWGRWMVLGFWHGACCFFIPFYGVGATVAAAGWGTDLWQAGTAVMTAVVVTVTLRVAIRTSYWTWINHAACWLTLLLWLPFVAVLGALFPSALGMAPLAGLGSQLLARAAFWLAAVFGAPAAAVVVDVGAAVLHAHLAPTGAQLLREADSQAVAAARKRGTLSEEAPNGSSTGSPPPVVAAPPRQGAAAAAGVQQQQAYGVSGAGVGQPPTPQQPPAVPMPSSSVRTSSGEALPPQPPPSAGGAGGVAGLLAGLKLRTRGRPGSSAAAAERLDLISGAGPASDRADVWGGGAGGGSGPRTLGGVADAEWHPEAVSIAGGWGSGGAAYVSASPQVLAQSHTKRQIRSRSYRAPSPALPSPTELEWTGSSGVEGRAASGIEGSERSNVQLLHPRPPAPRQA